MCGLIITPAILAFHDQQQLGIPLALSSKLAYCLSCNLVSAPTQCIHPCAGNADIWCDGLGDNDYWLLLLDGIHHLYPAENAGFWRGIVALQQSAPLGRLQNKRLRVILAGRYGSMPSTLTGSPQPGGRFQRNPHALQTLHLPLHHA